MLTPLLFGLAGATWGMDTVYAIMIGVAAVAAIPVWLMKSPLSSVKPLSLFSSLAWKNTP